MCPLRVILFFVCDINNNEKKWLLSLLLTNDCRSADTLDIKDASEHLLTKVTLRTMNDT